MVWIHRLKPTGPSSTNTADLVGVAFVVAEHVGAVEHDDPGIVGMILESCRGPVAQLIPKRNFFTHDGA